MACTSASVRRSMLGERASPFWRSVALRRSWVLRGGSILAPAPSGKAFVLSARVSAGAAVFLSAAVNFDTLRLSQSVALMMPPAISGY